MDKPSYNEIIKAARKAKGLTQQELADKAEVSLRTVQRLEKGTVEISGFSLRQICKVLDIPLESLIMQNVDQISIDNNQVGSVKNLYLSSLFFIINPILGFLVPYIYGKSKQNSDSYYNMHFRKIIKFHVIYNVIIIILFLVFIIITFYKPAKYQFPSYLINSLFLWQLVIITYLFYIPISTIWTVFAFRKIMKNV